MNLNVSSALALLSYDIVSVDVLDAQSSEVEIFSSYKRALYVRAFPLSHTPIT